MPIILNKHIKDNEGKYLVFCKSKKHLAETKDTVIEWFKIAGFKDIHSYVVHSTHEGKDKEYKIFCNDTSHSLKLLFCVNMLNEGLHLENISGVLLLRPTKSNIIWLQQIGRCIESNNSKNPVIIDAVNNFNSVQQGSGLLQEIKEAVEKEKADGNKKSGDSDLIDIDTFFVTEYVQDVQEMFKKVEAKLKDSWDLHIRALKEFKEKNGSCLVPKGYVHVFEDDSKIHLGNWVNAVRTSRKEKNNFKLTQDRINQLNLLGFIWYVRENRFDKFYEYVLLYKEKYGHVDIKQKDKLDGYNIGEVYRELIKWKKKGKLTKEQVDKLSNIGIDITKRVTYKEDFQNKMKLAKKALSEGVVITNKDSVYHGINFYNWRRVNKNKFTKQELEVMNKLVLKQRKRA